MQTIYWRWKNDQWQCSERVRITKVGLTNSVPREVKGKVRKQIDNWLLWSHVLNTQFVISGRCLRSITTGSLLLVFFLFFFFCKRKKLASQDDKLIENMTYLVFFRIINMQLTTLQMQCSRFVFFNIFINATRDVSAQSEKTW